MEHHLHHASSGNLEEWLPVFIVSLVGLIYIYGFFLIKNKSRRDTYHAISFIIGICIVVFAITPSFVQWAHIDFRGHMVLHLLIAMYAPIFLVMGAPIRLALKSVPAKSSRSISLLLKSPIIHFLSHPITALFLNIGSMYLLYLTPIYKQTLVNPALHHFVHFHFVAAGYLFTWSIIGIDPSPTHASMKIKVVVLFTSIAFHAFLSKFMYAYRYPINSPHDTSEIQEGAKLMYYWGDLSEFLVIIILFSIWYQKRGVGKYSLSPIIYGNR